MNKEIEKIIISEYTKGNSSILISKKLNLSKPTVLKILKKYSLIRKRNRCESLDIVKDGDRYYVLRECPKCKMNIKTSSKDSTIACRNHFNKIKNNSLCKKCSLILQRGEGNPFYGKKHSEKSLLKISNSRRNKCLGKNNAMSNPKWKKKATENLKKKWLSGDLEYVRKIMSEKLKETRRLGKIKSVVTSRKEKEIIDSLRNVGYETINSYRIDTKICDMYIPSLNLIIEYFGDYWHCNPNKYDSKYFNKKKNMYAEQIWDYDKRKVDLIVSYGYNLEVLWENDLKYNNNKLIQIITKYDTRSKFAPERS